MTNKEAIKSLQNIVEYWAVRPTEQEAAKLAIKALEQQEKDQWIPISDETNPKKSDIYLATFEENGNRYVERFYFSNFNGWLMPIPWQDEGHIDKMIAWRPFPEPHKEPDLVEKVKEDLSNWTQWKKDAYNEEFVSAHSTKLE